MKLFLEILQFLFYSGLIVLISKYILVKTLRNLAENLKLKPKNVCAVVWILDFQVFKVPVVDVVDQFLCML